MGGLGWKDHWFKLEPVNEYEGDVMERRVIPSHQAFNLKWPTQSEKGEINYHYDKVFINVTFDSLYPLQIIRDSVGESSDYFIANAILQGQVYEINGIILYHRLRYSVPHPSIKKE